VRPGDYIVISGAEAKVLMSDGFRQVAPADLTSKIVLEPDEPAGAYYRLALPKVGERVIEALIAFAAHHADAREAMAAEHLAGAIARRIAAT
jgi:hypothetical protein